MVSIDELFRLNRKVALVIAGYGGIDEAACQGLVAAGAKFAVAGHDTAPAACGESPIVKGHHLRINSAGAPSGPSAVVFVSSPEFGRSKDHEEFKKTVS
jgi:NAD(P)-dependent dehydrogenase (short-subunit alcohol dehydrogenase family)